MTAYCSGHNTAGYLPEGDVSYAPSFDDAKASLIHDLLFHADYADDATSADAFAAAAEDANLWSATDAEWLLYVEDHGLPVAWWIMEVSDEEYAAADPEGYEEYAAE